MNFVYTSPRGETFDFANNEYFYLLNVDGLTAAETSLSALTFGNMDGDLVTNIAAQARTLVLDLRVKDGVNVERATRQVLRVVKLKQNCTIYWTQNARTWKMDGLVEAIEQPRFNNSVTMQVTIHCSKGFWEDVTAQQTEISDARPLHYFTSTPGDELYFPVGAPIPLGEYDTSRTKDFVNNGDVAVGMQIEILAYKTATNPIIYGADGVFFGVGYDAKPVVMAPGDKIVIDTRSGSKSVTLNGVNVLEKIKPRSTWLQLAAGENEFSIDADETDTDNVTFTLIYTQRYI